ncbi:MAG: UDP-N-acetylmuramoyl-L-alanyl-D-glutamate--2,6-diaminopimelate ligase [Alphaproteobacteria bacterium]
MIDLPTITGLTQDSRKVRQGCLFAAFKGEQSDGRDYIPQAIEAGAKIILTDPSLRASAKQSSPDVEFIFDETPRQTFAQLCAQFYTEQPVTITAVTGTNGKTSIVNFTQQIWQALGYNAAMLGTLSGNLTTADPVTLHETLKDKAEQGITHLAMEASSHGLDQYRLDGVKLSAAGFTNLSRDHLDYHGDMEAYFNAKSRLFTELLPSDKPAIINADDEWGQKLIPLCKNPFTYGYAGSDLKLIKTQPLPHGQKIELIYKNETYRTNINLVGEFQTLNLLCALGLVLTSTAVDEAKAIAALETIKGARGRLEAIDSNPIYVDYAHTPDALEHVLNALRPHTQSRLICVFGCGGDRDKGKRSEMGKIAATLADKTIITDDNPRSEDPAAIRAQILSAAPEAQEIPDRHEAIRAAIKDMEQGDVLLIAGKGHEQGQIFATHTDPFDDKTEIQKILKNGDIKT